jgi:hypothetical protein
MGFLTKAAAIALSVLASVFGEVEAPEAGAVRERAPMRAVGAPQPIVWVTKGRQGGTLLFVPRPATGLDSESQRFLELITRGREGSKPMARRPWFVEPSANTTADVLQALFGDGGGI